MKRTQILAQFSAVLFIAIKEYFFMWCWGRTQHLCILSKCFIIQLYSSPTSQFNSLNVIVDVNPKHWYDLGSKNIYHSPLHPSVAT